MKWLVFFIANFSLHAQAIYPVETYFSHSDQNNVYFKDVNLVFNKFLGTWEYSTPNEYFKIEFFQVIKEQEAPALLKLTRYWDVMKSHFLYKKKVGGAWQVIYDTFPGQSDGSGSYYISGTLPDNFSTMKMDYHEPATSGTCRRNRSGDLTLVFLPGSSGPKLQWTRVERGRTGLIPDALCPDTSPRDASEFEIPAAMILTKVN